MKSEILEQNSNTELDSSLLPKHVAIIMDGNGRWAQAKGLPRTSGHKEGLETAKRIVKVAAEIGIKYVTLYTFSTENWKRAQDEVGYLMNLIRSHLRAEFEFYKSNGIRIEHIGDLKGLPKDVQEEIIKAKEDTKLFSGLTVVLAINYGGKDEIIRATKKMLSTAPSEEQITEAAFYNQLDIPNLPDVDLMIRTGGEKRISNFLLWHAAYAELIFSNTLWPDYGNDEFLENIREFEKRNRRFGSVK